MFGHGVRVWGVLLRLWELRRYPNPPALCCRRRLVLAPRLLSNAGNVALQPRHRCMLQRIHLFVELRGCVRVRGEPTAATGRTVTRTSAGARAVFRGLPQPHALQLCSVQRDAQGRRDDVPDAASGT